MHIKRPKRPKRAAGKFNSSPVLGEVPQAEGYEGYNTAAFCQASAWQLCLLGVLWGLKVIKVYGSKSGNDGGRESEKVLWLSVFPAFTFYFPLCNSVIFFNTIAYFYIAFVKK